MHKVIMDVDPGIDDSLAIVLALKSPEINVDGITVVSGNVEVNQATKNAIKAVHMAGKNVRVFKGEALPLRKPYVDATDTHGRDGIGENFFEDIPIGCEDTHAVDYILETVRTYPHEIVILALGPLTNIAVAIQKDFETMKKVKKIMLMGGSARYHGNCSPVAEYNFWVDPDAAHIVFQSGIEITMVGLDVTHKIIFSPNLREVIRQFNTELARYVYDITSFYVDFHWKQERTIGCVINDPLAVAVLIDPTLVKNLYGEVDVETEGIAIGQSVVKFSDEARVHTICMDVDAKRFFQLFFTRLFPEFEADLELAIEKQIWS